MPENQDPLRRLIASDHPWAKLPVGRRRIVISGQVLRAVSHCPPRNHGRDVPRARPRCRRSGGPRPGRCRPGDRAARTDQDENDGHHHRHDDESDEEQCDSHPDPWPQRICRRHWVQEQRGNARRTRGWDRGVDSREVGGFRHLPGRRRFRRCRGRPRGTPTLARVLRPDRRKIPRGWQEIRRALGRPPPNSIAVPLPHGAQATEPLVSLSRQAHPEVGTNPVIAALAQHGDTLQDPHGRDMAQPPGEHSGCEDVRWT